MILLLYQNNLQNQRASVQDKDFILVDETVYLK